MADESDEATEAQLARHARGPGRYFALVLLLLMLEGAVGYWILNRAVPAPPEPPKEEEAAPAKKKKVQWVPPIYFDGLKEMVVEPTAFRGNRMVEISLVLEVDAKAVADELTLRKTAIWDLVLQRLDRLTLADFRDPEKKKLKSDLLEQLNAALKNPGVTQIYITHLIMQ